MIKAVLVDLDDTLMDFHRMKDNSVHAAVKAMVKAGLKMREEEAFGKIFEVYEKHGWEDQKAFQKMLRKASGKVDYNILAHGILAYRAEKQNHMRLYAGVRETLHALKQKGLTLGVVTDAPKLQAYTRLAELGIEDYFRVVVCFEDTREHKPSSLPFEKALSKLRLKPDEVLFVGNSLDRDIGGAQGVGMRAAWAKYGDTWRDKSGIKPEFVLESFRDLLKIV